MDITLINTFLDNTTIYLVHAINALVILCSSASIPMIITNRLLKDKRKFAKENSEQIVMLGKRNVLQEEWVADFTLKHKELFEEGINCIKGETPNGESSEEVILKLYNNFNIFDTEKESNE